MIKKLEDGKYRLLSHEGKNLGTFDTMEEAEKHEREVQYFKEHKNSKFSKEDAESIAETLGVEFKDFTADDLAEGMNVELEHKDITDGDPEETAKIALAHLKERADYYKKLKDCVEKKNSDEKTNAKDFPEFFYAKHMEAGLCGYENETVYIDVDTIKKISPSFTGKPVYVGHQKVDLEKIDEADGYVVDCNYNEIDGCLWSKILIKTDKAKEAIHKGWAVSNAYIPTEFSGGGQYHNIDFDRKIVNAIFTHLAIVPDPRYEGAKILTPEEYKKYCEGKKLELEELKNSKGGLSKMLNFFKTKKETVEVDAEAVHELKNGKNVSIKELIEFYETNIEVKENAKKNEKEEDMDEEKEKGKEEDGKEKEVELKFNAEDEIDYGGKKMKIKEFMDSYSKKNEAEKSEKEEEEKKEEEKKNQKYFDELSNARNSNSGIKIVDTEFDQITRGKTRYGSN